MCCEGKYVLYRKICSCLTALSFVQSCSTENIYIVDFENPRKKKTPVFFELTDASGNSACFLQTQKAYYFCVWIQSEPYYLYQENCELVLKKSCSWKDRIFLYLPSGIQCYSYCNLNGYFYVHTSKNTSELAEFGQKLTDFLYLKKKGTSWDQKFCKEGCPRELSTECSHQICSYNLMLVGLIILLLVVAWGFYMVHQPTTQIVQTQMMKESSSQNFDQRSPPQSSIQKNSTSEKLPKFTPRSFESPVSSSPPSSFSKNSGNPSPGSFALPSTESRM